MLCIVRNATQVWWVSLPNGSSPQVTGSRWVPACFLTLHSFCFVCITSSNASLGMLYDRISWDTHILRSSCGQRIGLLWESTNPFWTYMGCTVNFLFLLSFCCLFFRKYPFSDCFLDFSCEASATPQPEDFFSGATMSHDIEKLYHLGDPQDHEHNHQNHLNHIYWRRQHQAQAQSQHYRHLCSEEFASRELLHHIHSNNALEIKMMNGSMMGHCGSGSCRVSTMESSDSHSLSLSMSPQSQPGSIASSQQIADTIAECIALETKKRGVDNCNQKKIVHRKSLDTFGQRTSQYRGVTRSLDFSFLFLFLTLGSFSAQKHDHPQFFSSQLHLFLFLPNSSRNTNTG